MTSTTQVPIISLANQIQLQRQQKYRKFKRKKTKIRKIKQMHCLLVFQDHKASNKIVTVIVMII